MILKVLLKKKNFPAWPKGTLQRRKGVFGKEIALRHFQGLVNIPP